MYNRVPSLFKTRLLFLRFPLFHFSVSLVRTHLVVARVRFDICENAASQSQSQKTRVRNIIQPIGLQHPMLKHKHAASSFLLERVFAGTSMFEERFCICRKHSSSRSHTMLENTHCQKRAFVSRKAHRTSTKEHLREARFGARTL